MSAGQQRAVNAEGYHPRPTTRAAFVVEPDGRRPKSIAERGWVRFGGTVTELGWAAIHSGQWKNPPALVMRQLRARQERSYVNLQRYCEERHAAEDKAQADRLLMPPPPPPPSSPACVDTAKKCKNKHCENLAKQKKCKKFCGLCEPLPPSAPPSPSLPEVNCRGLSDDKACKIKIKKCEMKPPKSMKKCKKKCKNDAKKDPPLCQKTCCNLGFPI